MSIRSHLLAGVAMTPTERAQGRYLRAPDGHGDGGAAPAPTPDPSPAPSAAESDDFAAFETSVDKPEASEDPPADNNSSGDNVDPATPGADDADDGDPPAPADPQGASVQERIDELTAKHREAERALAEERRLRAEERAAWEARQPKPEDKPGEGETREEDQRPDPSKYEFGEADSKYIADLARYETRQEIKAAREREQAEASKRALEADLTQMETTWTEKVGADEVKTKYTDFDEKVTKGADRGDWALSPVGVLLVKNSPVGPDVAYHLASNPDESRRIAGLNVMEQAIEIGRLEGRFIASATTAEAPAPKRASDAPAPPEHRSRGSGGKFSAQPDTEDFSAFDKMADGILDPKK